LRLTLSLTTPINLNISALGPHLEDKKALLRLLQSEPKFCSADNITGVMRDVMTSWEEDFGHIDDKRAFDDGMRRQKHLGRIGKDWSSNMSRTVLLRAEVEITDFSPGC
jgi:hypothetical protein